MGDVCVSTFCCCGALVQEDQEVQYQDVQQSKSQQRQQGYQAQPPIAYPSSPPAPQRVQAQHHMSHRVKIALAGDATQLMLGGLTTLSFARV